MTNLRLAIAAVAVLLVLLSITPLRRRLPLIRALPRGFELVLWLGFVSLCLGAFATVRTVHSTELSLAAAHAGANIAGQALGSVLASPAHWVAVHEPAVAIASVAVAGLVWMFIVARTWALIGRAVRPRPRLGGGWVVVARRRRGAQEPQQAPATSAAQAPAFVDANIAATYLGVSRGTVYRWARIGRLRSLRAGAKIHFSAGEVAAMRSQDGPRELNG
ncbi:MAG TPA: helix-turn-helix domain-containing protein [Candidatus Dormibacteraeota bacterium]